MKNLFVWARIATITAGLAFAICSAVPVKAGIYGAGPYGQCSFAVGCQHTTAQTPQGLRVAINLTDGQRIPDIGYTIEVTPLNGQGKSFNQVEFYLDGGLLGAFTPDANGTARWFWDTARQKGSLVTIVVYDTSSSVTQQFHVTIVPAASGTPSSTLAAATPPNPSAAGLPGPLAVFIPVIAAIKELPRPVALSIPYILLALLLLVIVMLIIQSRREVLAARRLTFLLQHQHQLAEQKDGFIELASHYLRTPLTIIKGSADLLATQQSTVDPQLQASLAQTIDDFGTNIELLLSRASTDVRLQAIKQASELLPRRLWARPVVWLPLAIIGGLVALCNLLLIGAGINGVTVGSLATQVMLYGALAFALYMAARGWQVRQRERQLAAQQTQQQIAIDEARNNLIGQAATNLSNKLAILSSFVPKLPSGQTQDLLREGCDRLAEVLRRFKAVATVIPPITNAPFTSFAFASLVSYAQRAMSKESQSKNVCIRIDGQDMQLASQQPSWVVQVVGSVLDNAVGYSAEGSQVVVRAVTDGAQATIVVADQGTGIPPDKLAELFQPFAKAEGPLQFDHPGLGLSLYLGRLLIGTLGGSIHITSQPGRGTEVCVIFPVRRGGYQAD